MRTLITPASTTVYPVPIPIWAILISTVYGHQYLQPQFELDSGWTVCRQTWITTTITNSMESISNIQTPYNDLNRLPYNTDINIFNPVIWATVSSSLSNKYFAPQNTNIELNDTPTSTTSNNPIPSPIGSLLAPPPNATHHQKDFGNLWLDKPYTMHNRTVSGSNSRFGEMTNPWVKVVISICSCFSQHLR